MEVLNESSSELEVGTSTESFQKFLDSQRELFHSQVDQLQNIVVKQCKLTGVNPLSQEMAAGAFSVKIGKKPRDLLNPKAVKYMHSVFSIKDAVSKKESREISALFGVTVTQVRDFFASQRSRVRKFVRLSREKVVGPKACKEQHDGHTVNSDSTLPIAPVPLNSVGPPIASVPLNSVGPPIAPVPLNSVGPIAPVPLNSATPPSTGEVPCCSTSNEVLPGIDDFEKHFIDNIFNLMRKEESFSGQVKLMEWILTLQNSSVLSWFLFKGGVMILATWLSQAAIEEQTSVLLVILKVLCHLPLHKALPVHMSAILQSVNRLRFYRAQDISNRARVLLSRWSKIFARSQAMKNPNAAKTSSDMHNERLLKQSIGEIMNDESWQSKADLSVQGVSPSYEISENSRKLEPPQMLKLLPASSDDSNRKHIRGASMTQTRERRKVQLVEQPGQKTAARSSPAFRAVPVSRGRPMSADDIQKAKTRALFMQSKYGKIASASSGSSQVKNGGLIKPSSSQSSVSLSVPRAEVQIKNEEHKDSPIPPSKISDQQLVAPLDLKQNLDSKEPSLEKGEMVQIPWHTPPEIRINSLWRVGGAENSKEVEVQKNRIRREKETVYEKLEDIPPGPREPWDLEMDYDDSLTLEIPTEQLPDPSDGAEPSVPAHEDGNGVATSEAGSSQISNLNAAEPDLELLAVLLKNPELVFSLTSGQGGGMSNEETVRLLDMIKAGTVCLPGNSNGVGGKGDERVEVSLPSPTPSSNPSTSGWRPEIAKNPFTQRDAMVNRAAYASSSAALAGYAMENVSANNMIPTQLQSSTAKFTVPQFPATVPPEMRPISRGPSLPHHSNPTNSPVLQIPVSELGLNMNNNLPLAYSNPMPITKLNKTEGFPAFLPSPSPSQMHLQQPTLAQPTSHFEKQSPAPDSWRSGHGSALNPASQLNEYGYNVGVRGPLQPQAQPGHWERGDFAAQGDFHTWSSECSPTRPRRNLSPQPGTSPSQYHRPLDRSQPRDSLRYRDQNSRHGDRRWRDRDRDWRR